MAGVDAVREVVLSTRDGALSVSIVPFGLTIHRMLLRKQGQLHDLLAGPERAADHRDGGRHFFGPVVGRYANRLPAGRHASDEFTAEPEEWGE